MGITEIVMMLNPVVIIVAANFNNFKNHLKLKLRTSQKTHHT